MKIHKEGKIIILTYLFFLLLLVIILISFFKKSIGFLIFSPSFFFLFFIVWFFRNPIRISNVQENEIVAPVDGKIVVIKKTFVKEFLNQECLQISIFMSPMNVHVCRYPVSGRVVYTQYYSGKYLLAWNDKSSELNERTTCVVETMNKNKILFRQIAGFIARRIVFYSKLNDKVNAGEEYGFIKFGSRLDVFLPLNSEICVKVGDRIYDGGKKIIARLITSN